MNSRYCCAHCVKYLCSHVRMTCYVASICKSVWTRFSGCSTTARLVRMMPVIPGNPSSVQSGPSALASAAASGCGKTGRTTVSAQA